MSSASVAIAESDGADEREHEPAVAESHLEPVEGELSEHRCVLPARRRRSRVGNARGDPAELGDLAAESGQPVRVGADRRHERTERDDERAREPREPRRRLGQRVHPAVIGRERPNLQGKRLGDELDADGPLVRTQRLGAPQQLLDRARPSSP